ncbi:MAG: hypothetical protein KAI75_07260 [Desulfobulbaceae bacterium]|nr:hypothetical protein [Desulfobulbaceae bacterium]
MKLYVGNLSHAMTEKELVKLFSSYGDVTGVNIIKDHHTRQSKNFGYIELSQEDGYRAVEEMNGRVVNRRSLVVKETRSRDERKGQGW